MKIEKKDLRRLELSKNKEVKEELIKWILHYDQKLDVIRDKINGKEKGEEWLQSLGLMGAKSCLKFIFRITETEINSYKEK